MAFLCADVPYRNCSLTHVGFRFFSTNLRDALEELVQNYLLFVEWDDKVTQSTVAKDMIL